MGAFTDRSTLRNTPNTIGQDRVDYYGGTLGVELRTPLALLKNPNPEGIVLSTTIAVRYAVGIGEARAATIDLTAMTPVTSSTVDVVYQEIVPYIGSGIQF